MATGRTLAVAGGVVGVVVVLVLVRLLVGSQDSDAPSYTPVPDDELYADISALPGIAAVQLVYDEAGGYTGTVLVGPGRELCPVLDRVFAILRQGRPDAPIDVTVAKEADGSTSGRSLRMEEVDPAVAADPVQRYGAQPGTGAPLDDRLCTNAP